MSVSYISIIKFLNSLEEFGQEHFSVLISKKYLFIQKKRVPKKVKLRMEWKEQTCSFTSRTEK